jgi:hypothetical protein
MAATNFSGPVVSTNGFTGNVIGDVTGDIIASSLQVPPLAATSIADAADAVNTVNKTAGTVVFDTTNSRLMIATGSVATDDWVAGDDSSTTVTPS